MYYSGGIFGGSGVYNTIDQCSTKCIDLVMTGYRGGGICGASTDYTTIKNSFAICEKIGSQAGGLIGGYSDGNTIENCYVQCSEIANYGSRGGGFIGRSSKTNTFTNCYFKGDINQSQSGAISGPYSTNITITNCYIVGTNSQANKESEEQKYLFGDTTSSNTISNCTINNLWNDTNANERLQNIQEITSLTDSIDTDTIYLSLIHI